MHENGTRCVSVVDADKTNTVKKANPNFRDRTWNVEENLILHELFRVQYHVFPATLHVISRKDDFLWDSV